MARARNIKPGFYKNEDLAECSIWARFIFPGLWMLADREGRLEDRPKRIKGELLPFDSQEIEPLLKELEALGFILRYEVNCLRLIQIIAFTKHQNPHHREQKSDLPPPQSPGLYIHSNNEKPEALYALDDSKAQDEPEILNQRSDLQGGVSRADSLIPSSLIPDSNTASSASTVTTVDPPTGECAAAPPEGEKLPETQGPTRAGSIAMYLLSKGIDTSSTRAEVIDFANDPRITDQVLDEAIAKAKAKKPNERIPSGFLRWAIEEILNPKATKKADPPWWLNEKTIEAKAREVGCWPARANESWPELKQRIEMKIRELSEEKIA